MMARRDASAARPARRLRIGGFNLVPYRQRAARGARRRTLAECLIAAFAGFVAVGAWAGWDALARARLDVKRAAAESTLASLGAPLAEYERLERLRADEHARAALARTLSAPRARLLDLFGAMSQKPNEGIVLTELKQTERDVTLLASASDSVESAAWLTALSAAGGAQAVELVDVRHATASPGNDAAVGGYAVELTARLRWPDSLPSSADDGLRRRQAKGAAR